MSGSRLEIGLVLPTLEKPQSGEKSQWPTIKTMAQQAEAMGFDTVWIADELLWRVPDWPGARGWWECVSMTGGGGGEHFNNRRRDLGAIRSPSQSRPYREDRRDARRDQRRPLPLRVGGGSRR